MSITRQDIEQIANLSRLTLTEGEKEHLTVTLSQILNFAEELQELDVEHVAPTTHTLPLNNVLRDDTVRPWLSQDEALSHAPDQENGQFRVPAVMEG
ncbi:Asp-tRNA(Asn)/Glu-tRNA(Gln) amidotransferase GatCAB subunit C [Tumebacillus algifaecis]|uniref:Aspartyl/glutamyl-tRNA(Asn/Gln) amidotransferase subunit C n=1 Tax=Tumebacillus algifaecis TaxID=1214604 RepID=A0A223CXU1_9BACL|nr:Asp-tRNA(Asn)/Glu-tRNA(Gln) amidotransferase subunit GatC [Tumebacillus algifaecis]ASS74199.1 Asp-tRNA(Asn)/Glu-tRNA(Gln) amidotransferase GatCAB subunit C [Tumebacillus algifaecis]